MSQFATEFPIDPENVPGRFAKEVFSWLAGTRYSKINEAELIEQTDQDSWLLLSSIEEELKFRQLRKLDSGEVEAIGFRYDYPADDGIVWRTESVLRRGQAQNGQDLIRVRVQCLPKDPFSYPKKPQKPFFIKRLISGGFGGLDKLLFVTDEPCWLENNKASLKQAGHVIEGNATDFRPVVYVSAVAHGSWIATPDQITKLAYDLGGVAAVVVEPNRSFSFDLKDLTDGKNVYGGAIGVSLPGYGVIRRFLADRENQSVEDLMKVVRSFVLDLSDKLPQKGWDWAELNEEAVLRDRESERDSLDIEALERSYQKQIESLKDKNDDLKEQLRNANQAVTVAIDNADFLTDKIEKVVGPELYTGEMLDRIIGAVKIAFSQQAENQPKRNLVVWEAFLKAFPYSKRRNELNSDLEKASKDPKKFRRMLAQLLDQCGYEEKSDNKHTKFAPRKEYSGLDIINLPKTPSDHRALTNIRKQIQNRLGI